MKECDNKLVDSDHDLLNRNHEMVEKDRSSIWTSTVPELELPALKEDIQVDVAIVGGGICGLTTALLLMEAGKKVAIFEAYQVGYGATGFTTGKITSQHSLIYQDIVSGYGKEEAQQYANANEEAISTIEGFLDKYKIDCDYVKQNAYVYANSDEGFKKLEMELEIALELGLPASLVKPSNLPFEAKKALCFERQGMFHPMKYIQGVVKVLTKQGVSIYEHTRITDIDSEQDQVRTSVSDQDRENNKDLYTLKTEGGSQIVARHVVLATKYPILNKKRLYFAKLSVKRTYGIAVTSKKISFEGMYMNEGKPVRSLRMYQDNQGNKWVIVVGASHQTGECSDTHKPYEELIAFAKEMDEDAVVVKNWSTQDCMTSDNIPYIGSLSPKIPNILIATGFSKWGLSHSAVAAKIISNIILGHSNQFYSIYDPQRGLSLKAKKQLVISNVEVAGDILSKILPVEEMTPESLDFGEGRVMRYQSQVIGAYKNEAGEVFIVDPTCRHMGCRLVFNTAEKTWDCPCHGSRYTFKGEVIEAPAVHPLEIPQMDKIS